MYLPLGKVEKQTKTVRAYARVGLIACLTFIAVGFVVPKNAWAGIGRVQYKTGANATSPLTITIAPSRPGNLLAALAITNFDADTMTVTDDKGQTWTKAYGANGGSGGSGTFFVHYFPNTVAGVTQVTFTASAANHAIDAYVIEYSGAAISNPVGTTLSNSTLSGTQATVSITTTSTGVIAAFAAVSGIGGPMTSAGGGFTFLQRSPGSAWNDADEDRAGPSGSYTPTFNWANSDIWNVVAVSFQVAAGGIQVSSRSDTLSDSRPSATSNHTVVFTVNNAIYGSSVSNSSTLTLALPSDFTIPANMDCGDVDAATSVQFNFNYPGCVATATAWGFSATGYAITLVPPSGTGVYVPTSTQVTIKIGSNATQQQQGIHWITNPSTTGIYTISVGGTFGGSGNILVSINSAVTVQATVAESLSLTVNSITSPNCTADDGASITQINTTANTVPFGTISANAFYQGCQDLVVSTNAGNGYSLTVQESSNMKTPNGAFTIPDTNCDAGTCTESAAAAWATATHNGLGHTCLDQVNHDCNTVYSGGTNFRQLANIGLSETAQAVMSSSTPASATGRIKFRLSVGAAQPAGAYTTLITYTIYGTY